MADRTNAALFGIFLRATCRNDLFKPRNGRKRHRLNICNNRHVDIRPGTIVETDVHIRSEQKRNGLWLIGSRSNSIDLLSCILAESDPVNIETGLGQVIDILLVVPSSRTLVPPVKTMDKAIFPCRKRLLPIPILMFNIVVTNQRREAVRDQVLHPLELPVWPVRHILSIRLEDGVDDLHRFRRQIENDVRSIRTRNRAHIVLRRFKRNRRGASAQTQSSCERGAKECLSHHHHHLSAWIFAGFHLFFTAGSSAG